MHGTCPQVTALAAVPAMISDLVAHHAQLPGRYPAVRRVLLGAASADPALLPQLHALFPNAQARLNRLCSMAFIHHKQKPPWAVGPAALSLQGCRPARSLLLHESHLIDKASNLL